MPPAMVPTQPGTPTAVATETEAGRSGIEGTVCGGPAAVVKSRCGEHVRRTPCHVRAERLLFHVPMATRAGYVNPFSKAILSFAIGTLLTRS
jgi:hypothetical protein